MESLSRNSSRVSQWQLYKQLELIPDSVPNPQTHSKLGLSWVWRSLIELLIDELIDEQEVDYLERCWTLEESEAVQQSPSKTLQRLWILMN